MSDVSVLVPSFGRASSLRRCLLSISSQTTCPRQVVVVAQRADSETRAVAEAYPWVDTILVELPGVAHAVERGIAACTSRVVALTDDDAEPLADWVARIDVAYAARPNLGAFGGRDLVVGDTDPLVDSKHVGRIQWFGRITGYHHRGTGAAAEVDHLKGVNLTVLRYVAAGVPLESRTRGRGAQYGFELQLCLAARQQGFVVVYDPHLQVVHHAAPRGDGSAREALSTDQIAADTHNVVLAARAALPLRRAVAVLAWTTLVGERKRPGVARATCLGIRTLATPALREGAAALSGARSGWRSGSLARQDRWPSARSE